jgi:hypothetical protein
MPLTQPCPREYLTVVRKLGPSAQVDSEAATYVTSLTELSTVSYPFFILVASLDKS